MIEKLRAWWWERQCLNGAGLKLSAAGAFERCGWARSVGGCGPYIALFSRAGISRESVDQAVANLEIYELPCARGCTYVVPAADYALALQAAQHAGSTETKTAEKLGVPAKEIDKLCAAVLASLKKRALTPDEIREACGSAVRSLGPEGQKKGLSSTLPVALGLLQRAGDIRRISTNGRLDQQRYQYALWQPNPIGKSKLCAEEVNSGLARRFFQWIGSASLTDFQTFAGISAKAAKSAVADLKLEPLGGEGQWLIPAALRPEFEACKPSKDPQYRLLISIDSFLLLRRDNGGMIELPSPAILDRGEVIGLWEYDPETESIAHSTFKKNTDSVLKKAIVETETYIRTQLGDARTFSLDSPKSRAPRIRALREQSGLLGGTK